MEGGKEKQGEFQNSFNIIDAYANKPSRNSFLTANAPSTQSLGAPDGSPKK